MRIVAITMVKNEIDIIEAMVRHTAAVADHVVVLDHASADGTRDVLTSLRSEGLPISIIEESSPAKRQGEWMTRLLHDHALDRHAADWVLPLDADEFVQPDRDGLIADANDSDRPIGLQMKTYIPTPDADLAQLNPVLRITARRRAEPRLWYKVFVPAGLARPAGARLTEGNHELAVGDTVVPSRPARIASVAHFPVRSPGQYMAKIAIGYLSRQVIPDRRSDWGFHYRAPFEQLKSNPKSLAAHYADFDSGDPARVSDPIGYRGGPLRYTTHTPDHWRPAQSLACFAENLAQDYAAFAHAHPPDEKLFIQRFAELLTRLHRQLIDRDIALLSRSNEIERMHEDHRLLYQRCESLLREIDARDRDLRVLSNSWTWRAGRLLIAPVAILKRALGRRPGVEPPA